MKEKIPKGIHQSQFKNIPLDPGILLGRYTIIKKLASGGFGVVYQAQRSDGEMVALKEFLPAVLPCRVKSADDDVFFKNERYRNRFQDGLTAFFREADTLSKLHLTQVVSIWDVFESRGTAYFAMPLELGMTLRHWVYKSIPILDTNKIIRLILSACDGVHTLHDHGLLHLDLKPGNLWVRPNQDVLVLDLGASRWEDEEGRLSQLARTPGFAAPEQHAVKDVSVLTVKTDIYGMAATLLSCLEQTSPPSALHRTEKDMPFAKKLAGRHSSQLLEVIDYGMQLKQKNRPVSILEWKKELNQCLPGGLLWGNCFSLKLQETPPPQIDFSSK